MTSVRSGVLLCAPLVRVALAWLWLAAAAAALPHPADITAPAGGGSLAGLAAQAPYPDVGAVARLTLTAGTDRQTDTLTPGPKASLLRPRPQADGDMLVSGPGADPRSPAALRPPARLATTVPGVPLVQALRQSPSCCRHAARAPPV